MRVYIEGRRNGYSPEQCGRTMTVGDLIAYLAFGSWLVVLGTSSANSFPFGLPMMGLGTDRLVLCSFLQGDEGDFRAGADAGREERLAQADVDVEML